MCGNFLMTLILSLFLLYVSFDTDNVIRFALFTVVVGMHRMFAAIYCLNL